MNIRNFTKTRRQELAEYLEGVWHAPLEFEGNNPLKHSSRNHIHLWKLEYCADHFAWIDTDYRVDFITYVLEFWRNRLKGRRPHTEYGYRVYGYDDTAPTLSVVAETPVGFPYAHLQASAQFVPSIRDVVKLYVSRSWKAHFAIEDWEISREQILKTIQHTKRSIGKPTAQKLGIQVGALRTLIVNMGLDNAMNTIRKKFQRVPADFGNEPAYEHTWRIFERKLPPKYT